MDIALARTFLAVIETGSFIHAAEKIYTTQSTVSARIKNLESLLGRQLFERSKSGVRLTPSGEQFQKHAMALIRVWQHAQLEVGLAEGHRDHMAVGAQVSLWDGFLLKWLAWMRNELSDLAVTATVGFSSRLIERLGEGTLDLAIVYRQQHSPGLVVEHLFDEELVLVSSHNDGGAHKPDKDYVFVNWGPEFQADHAEAYPDFIHMGLHLDIGSLGLNYLFENKASGYFPLRIVRPFIENETFYLIKKARKFLYPVYMVFPEERDEEAYEPVLQALRDMADEV